MTDTTALAEKMREFYWQTHRVVDRVMKEHGVSASRTKLLLFIEKFETVRSADVVESFGQAPRTVTEALDTLERDGLIRRDPDPNDRRAKRISLTEAGLAALRSVEPARRKFMQDIFGVLDAGEIDALAVLLDKLNERLNILGRP